MNSFQTRRRGRAPALSRSHPATARGPSRVSGLRGWRYTILASAVAGALVPAGTGGTLLAKHATPATASLTLSTADGSTIEVGLPRRTSRYNVGGAGERYKRPDGTNRSFALKNALQGARLFDGAGRVVARVRGPVMLNRGAKKVFGGGEHRWVFNAKPVNGRRRVSGWIRRNRLLHPPSAKVNPTINPPPPESGGKYVIDTQQASQKLAGLRFPNSRGVIPASGNRGTHYGGRNPGRWDYVYLLFSAPNVRHGGTAKDSLPNSAIFVPGREANHQIRERVTMYRDGNLNNPVPVYFIYGRQSDAKVWGWIAQANLKHPGERGR